MKVTRIIKWLGYSGYRIGSSHQQIASSCQQDEFFRGLRGRGRYRVEYSINAKRPEGGRKDSWQRLINVSTVDVGLRNNDGRIVAFCKMEWKELFGTALSGWVRITKLPKVEA